MHGSKRTLAEVNCRLCDLDNARQRMSMPACPDIFTHEEQPIPFDPAAVPVRSPAGIWPSNYVHDDQNSAANPAFDVLNAAIAQTKDMLTFRKTSSMSQSSQIQNSPPLAWHTCQPLLAAADSQNAIQIFEFTNKIPYLGQTLSSLPDQLAPVNILAHELQQIDSQQPTALAWRPCSGLSLAVGSSRGICLWHLTSPTDKTPSMVWLQSPGEQPVDNLCWHPKGRLLAAASQSRAGFFIVDASTGSVTPIRAGFTETVSMLRWSPCENFLFVGNVGGSFRLYETATWKSAKWTIQSPTGAASTSGELIGAEWAPDGRTIVLAHAKQLTSMHLTGSLSSQILPVTVAELNVENENGQLPKIEKLAWDTRGQRLAVALSYNTTNNNTSKKEKLSSTVALYDTRCDPIFTARFIGYAQVSPMGEIEEDDEGEDWEIVVAEGEESEENVGGGVEKKKRAGLAFMPKFEQGAVLAVRRGEFIGTVPMYFSL